MVRPWCITEVMINAVFIDVLRMTACCMQVLCTSWWNTLRKATLGSTCGRGGRREWTTPLTPVKSLTSSSPSKTWCPVPTRWPEAWSTSPRRRSAANAEYCLNSLCGCVLPQLNHYPKGTKKTASCNVRMLSQVLTFLNVHFSENKLFIFKLPQCEQASSQKLASLLCLTRKITQLRFSLRQHGSD